MHVFMDVYFQWDHRRSCVDNIHCPQGTIPLQSSCPCPSAQNVRKWDPKVTWDWTWFGFSTHLFPMCQSKRQIQISKVQEWSLKAPQQWECVYALKSSRCELCSIPQPVTCLCVEFIIHNRLAFVRVSSVYRWCACCTQTCMCTSIKRRNFSRDTGTTEPCDEALFSVSAWCLAESVGYRTEENEEDHKTKAILDPRLQ